MRILICQVLSLVSRCSITRFVLIVIIPTALRVKLAYQLQRFFMQYSVVGLENLTFCYFRQRAETSLTASD